MGRLGVRGGHRRTGGWGGGKEGEYETCDGLSLYVVYQRLARDGDMHDVTLGGWLARGVKCDEGQEEMCRVGSRIGQGWRFQG